MDQTNGETIALTWSVPYTKTRERAGWQQYYLYIIIFNGVFKGRLLLFLELKKKKEK